MSYHIAARSVLIFIACWALPIMAHAEDGFPNNWPWRGVSIGFPGGGVADLERYKKRLPINVVRLNVNPRRYAEINYVDGGKAFEQAMDWTDLMLDACSRLGIGAVIQINHFPLDPTAPYEMSDFSFWKSVEAQNEVVSVSRKLAERYTLRGEELVAYQVISEPVVHVFGKAIAPPQWPKLLGRIVLEIRKFDKNRWIIASPAPGGSPEGYADFHPPEDHRLIWGSHVYLPHAYTHQGIKGRKSGVGYPGFVGLKRWDKDVLRTALSPLIEFQKQHPAPVYIGEFSAVRWGQGSEQYLVDLASIFNKSGWGWAYFSATGWHGWNPDYNSEFSDDNPQNWEKDYVGDSSARWRTLDVIFSHKYLSDAK